jgi:hypothetical protein
MMLNYRPYIPKTIDEVIEQLGFIFIKSPTFEDPFFIGRNVETVFAALKEGLQNIRTKIGEERYAELMSLSDLTRAYFEADPEDSIGQAREGRKLVREMQATLQGRLKDEAKA